MPVIYLDESGALNKTPKQRFFIVAALVTEHEKNRRRLKNLCRRLHVDHCVPNNLDEIHASQLSFPAKQDILKRLNALGGFHLDYLAVDKKHIIPALFEKKNLCYNYLVGVLVKKCLKGYAEPVNLLIDNHSIKAGSLNSLQDYLIIEATTRWGFNYPITVELIDSRNCKGVQLVDVVSNAIFAKYNLNVGHLDSMCETNYRHRLRFPYEKFGT